MARYGRDGLGKAWRGMGLRKQPAGQDLFFRVQLHHMVRTGRACFGAVGRGWAW